MILPPTVAPFGPVLVIVTSAETEMIVLAELLLFDGFVSDAEVETTAVLETIIPFASDDDAFTVRENCADCPFKSVGMLQTTLPAEPAAGLLQLALGPVDCVMDANVVPAGRVSVKDTVDAGSGPLLDTVMVYVKLDPAVAVGGAVLVIPTSAVATDVNARAASLSGFGSLALVTNAMFV